MIWNKKVKAKDKLMRGARFDFTFEILEQIIPLQKKNVFFSPCIIYDILWGPYFISRDTLENTLKRILHIPDEFSKADVKIFLALEKLDRSCEEVNESCTSRITNSSWFTTHVENSQNNMRESAFGNYQSEIATLNINIFSDRNSAILHREINDWVLDVTENIPDMLPQGSVSENDNLVLVSAVRFKDVWDNPDLGPLSKLIFSRLDMDTSLPSMPRNVCVQIKSTKLNAYIVEKPFLYGDVSIFKLIPVSSNTNSPQTENLSSNPKINEIMRLVRCLKTEEGSRELRRLMDEGIAKQKSRTIEEFQWFGMEGNIAMRQLFDALGVGEILARDAIYLRNDRDGREIYFRDAVHRAKITIDRDGSCATASTAIGSFCCNSVPAIENPDFNVKTSFLFLIYDKRSSNILFAGIMIEDAEDIANVSPRPKRRRLDKEQVPGKSTD